MKETPDRLALRLEAEAEKTLNIFCRLAPDLWHRTVYHENNGWNSRQILAHFVSAEAAFLKLIEDIMHGGGGASADLVIDQFNESEVKMLAEATPEELLASFIENRAMTVKLVRGMRDSDLLKMGRHPFLGMASLEEIIKLVYRHNQIHIREMRQNGFFD